MNTAKAVAVSEKNLHELVVSARKCHERAERAVDELRSIQAAIRTLLWIVEEELGRAQQSTGTNDEIPAASTHGPESEAA